MGADYVKTLYTGDPETMQRAVEGATVPVVILGGDRTSDAEALLRQVRDVLRGRLWRRVRPQYLEPLRSGGDYAPAARGSSSGTRW